MVAGHVDVEKLAQLARAAPLLELPAPLAPDRPQGEVTIAVMRDSAFSFYYPESLEALEAAGARLATVSSLEATALPEETDALYVGGGFPETHAAKISTNRDLLASIVAHVEAGLPVYAECGGLMLLSRSIAWQGETFEMAGVLPVDVEVRARPQGHGYCVVRVDGPSPFFVEGTLLRGHEFHYSTIIGPSSLPTSYAVERGVGCFDNRDGLVYKNVLASYAHLHALGAPTWAEGLVRQAREHRKRREGAAQATTSKP
jgi:cobyrinic acid a,c-diamide synthase